jgi:hypothetical protein
MLTVAPRHHRPTAAPALHARPTRPLGKPDAETARRPASGIAAPDSLARVRRLGHSLRTTPGSEHGDGGERVPPRAGRGRPLPDDVREAMEASLGRPLDHVRVHVGPEAAAIGAHAFARGGDVHFQTGRYSPRSREGRRLLAHELAHVAQQETGRVRRPPGSAIQDDPALEAAADAVAVRALRAAPAPAAAAPSALPATATAVPSAAAPVQPEWTKTKRALTMLGGGLAAAGGAALTAFGHPWLGVPLAVAGAGTAAAAYTDPPAADPQGPRVSHPYNVTRSGPHAPRELIESTRAFTNRMDAPTQANEIAEGRDAGVRPLPVGSASFNRQIESRQPFKWTYDVYGNLNVIDPRGPRGGGDYKHTVASGGAPVFSAGEGGWQRNVRTGDDTLSIDDRSGHYHPTTASVQGRGLQAWQRSGYPVEPYGPDHRRTPPPTTAQKLWNLRNWRPW